MATILLQPDSLSFSKNLRRFDIAASSEISFKLSQGSSLIINESYSPNAAGRVIVDVTDVISNFLSFAIPSNNIFAQTSIAKEFTVEIDSLPAVTFTVIRGGVENLADTATNFLTTNWLTWQPQTKKVNYSQPEWLTYYATVNCVVKVKLYMADNTSVVKTLHSPSSGSCYSYNVQFAHIMTLQAGDKYGYYDIWVENTAGARLTYIQRYVYKEADLADEYFLFQNSLGGIDTAIMSGETNFNPDVEHKEGSYDDVAVQIDNYYKRLYEKSTGWLSKAEADWLFDFFNSCSRYKLVSGVLRVITLQESSISDSSQEDMKSFSFVYKFAEDRGLLNLPRTMDVLPTNLKISTPESLFFLAPRLVDFPAATLDDTLLFPVQSPFTQFWQKLSWGAVWNFLYDKVVASTIGVMAHVHDNFSVLSKFSESEGNLYYDEAPVGGGSGSDSGLQLGTTSKTAHRGDHGKAAYDHSLLTNIHFADAPVDGQSYARNSEEWVTIPSAGSAAVRLSTNNQVFEYDELGNLVDVYAFAWIYTTLFNISGDAIYYEFKQNGVILQNTTSSVLPYSPPLTFSAPAVISVNIRIGNAGASIVATDSISMYGIKPGADGKDAFTVVLSNPAHSFPANSDGTVTDYSGSGTDIKVWKGITPLPVGSGALTFGVTAIGYNVTAGSAATASTYIRRYYNASNMIAATARIEFAIVARDENDNEYEFAQIQSFTVSKKGEDGEGKSVKLTAQKQVFSYDSSGALKDSGSWFLTTQISGFTGEDVYYEWIVNSVSMQNGIWSTYGLVPPAVYANMPVSYLVNVRQGSTSGPILASDFVTIYGVKDPVDGEPSFTVVLSNEAHTLPADGAGVVSSYEGSGTDIQVWLGATPLVYGTGPSTFDVTASGTAITPGSASTVSSYTRRYGNHSAMTADQAGITYTIKVRNTAGTEITITKVQALTKAKKGEDGEGKSVKLTAQKQVFSYDSSGALKDSGSWFLTTQISGFTGEDVYYEWIVNSVSMQNGIWSTYGLVPPAVYANMPVSYLVNVRQGSTSGPILASDFVTIYGVKDPVDGEPSFTVVLSNEAHTLPADGAGVVSSYEGSGTDIQVWLGATPLVYGTGPSTFDVTASGTAITPGSASTVSSYTRRYGNHSAMTADQAGITYTIKVRNTAGTEITITKVQALTKAKKGADGTDGDDGTPGLVGPSLVFRGEYNSAATYVGNSKRIDMVKYTANGKYYAALADAGSFSGKAPIDAQYWEIADGQFEFVATKLLFAESTYVRNLIAEQLKTAESGRRVEINAGDKQQIAIYDAYEALKVLVKPEPITTLAVIQAGSATAYNYPTADVSTKDSSWSTPSFGPLEYSQESVSFVVTLDGTLEIEIGSISLSAGRQDGTYCAAMSTISVFLEKYTDSSWNFVGYIGSCSEYDGSKYVSNTIKGLSAGTYRLVAKHYHFSWTDWIEGMPAIQDSCSAYSKWSYGSGSSFAITVRRVVAQTEIGTDGIASIWASNKYLHFSQNGLFVKMGTKTFEVTETAVKINGTTYN